MLAGRRLDHIPYQVWVPCGDGELAEGSVWEVLDKAAHYELGNLTAIVDVNRLGQRRPTELGWSLEAYAARVRAFGCRAVAINAPEMFTAAERAALAFTEAVTRSGDAGVLDPVGDDVAVQFGGGLRRHPAGPIHDALDESPRRSLPPVLSGARQATRSSPT